MSEQAKVCFVVSPIGGSGSEIRQKADDFLEYIISKCKPLASQYKIVRGDQITEPGRITTQVIRLIESAELVIADVTGGNPNVYYELALRHAPGKPIITCAEKGTALPFDTRDHRTIFYTMHSRDAEQARKELSDQILVVTSGTFSPENPIFEATKIIKLAESNDTSDQALAQIPQKLDDLSGRVRMMEQTIARQSLDLSQPLSASGNPLLSHADPLAGGIYSILTAAPSNPLTARNALATNGPGRSNPGNGL